MTTPAATLTLVRKTFQLQLQSPGPQGVPGLSGKVYLGNGSSPYLTGHVNVSASKSWKQAFIEAQALLPSWGGTIEVLPADYVVDVEAAEINARDNITIQGQGLPRVTCTHNGPIQAFKIRSDKNCTIKGLHFYRAAYLAGARFIDVDGVTSATSSNNTSYKSPWNHRVAGNVFEIASAASLTQGHVGFVDASAFNCVWIANGTECRVEGNMMLPTLGCMLVTVEDGHGNWVVFNGMSNGRNLGVAEIQETGVDKRFAWAFIDVRRDEWAKVHDNYSFGLGVDSAGFQAFSMDYAIRYQGPHDVDNNPATEDTEEHGHFTACRNVVEACRAIRSLWVRGLDWGLLEANWLAFPAGLTDGPNMLGHGLIVIEGSLSPGEPDYATKRTYSQKVQAVGNQLHNGAVDSSNAAALFMRDCRNTDFIGNSITEWVGNHAVAWDGPSVRKFTAIANPIAFKIPAGRVDYSNTGTADEFFISSGPSNAQNGVHAGTKNATGKWSTTGLIDTATMREPTAATPIERISTQMRW